MNYTGTRFFTNNPCQINAQKRKLKVKILSFFAMEVIRLAEPVSGA